MSDPAFDFSFSGFWEGVENPDHWQTQSGILDRLGMLADQVIFGSFNNSLKVHATAIGITDFIFAGPTLPTAKGNPMCPYCFKYWGEVYRRGQFMPELPAHPHCRHFWDIVRVGSPEMAR